MKNNLRNNLVLAKIEKAREALDEAVWCYEGEKYPAAVNRLYYSIYRACLALLVGEEKVPVKHTAVIGLVNKKFVKENLLPREVGRFLHEIQTARIEGDYKEKSFEKEEVKELIENCKKTLKTIEDHLSSNIDNKKL